MKWGSKEPTAISRPLPAHLSSTGTQSFAMSGYTDSAYTLPRSMTGSSSLSSHKKTIKYGKGRHADIELVPQPSDDPEDPLNWSPWRKNLNLASLLVMVGLVGGMKTAFISTSGSLAAHYHVSRTSIAALTAAPILVSTVTGFIGSITAKLVGKRPVYLFSTLLLFIGTIWNSKAGDKYTSCLGARILQGLGWGAFDALVMGSIQDTYFEHERNLPVSLYNITSITTTWASPLLGGVASQNAGTFTVQFIIINCFYVLAVPLIALGAPETAFDRSKAAMPPLPIPGLDMWRPWRFRHRFNWDTITAYVKEMRFISFKGVASTGTILQAPRAIIAPTTCLLFVLMFIPFGALWGLATSVSILTTAPPLSLDWSTTGVLMTGPWIAALLVVGGFCFYRGFHDRFTRSVRFMVVTAGSMLALTGLVSFGLGLHNFMNSHPTSAEPYFTTQSAEQISLPLLSLQLGILASGNYILDTVTRPLLARSASFTSSSIAVAQRSIGDMQSGVVILRNLAAGAFILAMPSAMTVFGGLKAAVIGLGVTQVLITGGVMALLWYLEETIWRADGKIMGLVDLRLLKQSVSFFETD